MKVRYLKSTFVSLCLLFEEFHVRFLVHSDYDCTFVQNFTLDYEKEITANQMILDTRV